MYYIGVDIGGTKTLIALLDEQGQIVKSQKYVTDEDFNDFSNDVVKYIQADFFSENVKAIAVAAPGQIDYNSGDGIVFGNLSWHNVPIARILTETFHVPVVVENDANVAGIAEARALDDSSANVVYLTISTGIGTGVILNGAIDPARRRSEGGHMLFRHNGELIPWEKFASGKALYDRYNTYARDLEDEKAWREVAENIALGLSSIAALLCPEVVIIGGSLGTHLPKYERFLLESLEQTKVKMVTLPKILQAKHPEEAVVYGCYYLAKELVERG